MSFPLRFPDFALVGSLALLGCSSASFDVSNPGGSDSGTGVDTFVGDVVGTDTQHDAPPGDSTTVDGGGDGIVSDSVTTCSAFSPTTPEVYVDGASKAPEVGNSDCPFHTIRGATMLAWSTPLGTRTIHVLPGMYAESGAVRVRDHIVLAGASADKVQISGGGACLGGNCVVEVEGGGTIYGVTVSATGFAGNAITVDASSGTQAILHDLVAQDAPSPNARILARGGADIGPHVTCTANYRGIDSIGSGTLHVIGSASTDNLFETSGQSGVYVEGNAVLQFDGGEARKNGTNGIYLVGSGTAHVANLNAHDNTQNGLWVAVAASAVVRNSQFEGNVFGILFTKGSGNSLDLGFPSDHGNDTLGGASSAHRNLTAAVCVDAATSSTSIPTAADMFSTCTASGVGPALQSVDSCMTAGGYADLMWSPTSAPIPYNVSSCGTGP